jgi:asparagine N-glycosylation enzyme membrane subunit Stt3
MAFHGTTHLRILKMDTAAAVAAISGATANVTAVAGAVLGVLAVIVGYRLVRKVFG